MIKELLRLEDEEYIHFNEVQIHDVLVENTSEFMEYLKQFYHQWEKNSTLVELPKKQIFESAYAHGDFRVMPCIINADYRIKSVKIIGTNEENSIIKDKICVGKSFLIHPYDNYIYAMFDVCVLSSFRTAAISVLAYALLKHSAEAKIGIIGSGRIGFYTTLILHKWLGIDRFHINDISEKNKMHFLTLAEKYMPNATMHFINTKQMGTTCNSVFVATDSSTSILNKENAQNITFISSVGADANNLSEIDADLIDGRSIVTDSHHSMMIGDLKTWEKENIITKDTVVELPTLLHHTMELEEKILFISTGIATQDALISQFIYDTLT